MVELPKTMRAAVLGSVGGPLELRDVPVPVPGHGQLLVRVRACGICHTDLHAVKGDWPEPPVLPLIPGHETVGEVVTTGPGVEGIGAGDRVGVPFLHRACGHCEYCLTGRETLCADRQYSGYSVDGGFAEYMVAEAGFVAPIPDGIDVEQAAPLMCAGVTVYTGLKNTGARPGDWVVIYGIGGLGHLAVQYARAMGLRAIAVDRHESKLDLAADLGAEMTVDDSTVDSAAYLQRRIGGAHAALVTAAAPSAIGRAIAAVRKGSTVVINGLPPGTMPFDVYDVVMRELTVRGSLVGTRNDLNRAIELAAHAGIRASVVPMGFEEAGTALARLENWPVPGRMVLRMD